MRIFSTKVIDHQIERKRYYINKYIFFFAYRRNNKKSPSKKKVTDNIYYLRKNERLQGDQNNIRAEQSAVKADIEGSQNYQFDENRGSGYWMVENSFYLSADNVVKDNEDGRQNVSDINPSVYSDINDSENNVDCKNTASEYDYAQIRGFQ